LDPQRTNITAEQLRLALEAVNIEARPIWKPLHLQPVFTGAEYHGRGVSDHLFGTGLCLPSGSAMTVAERNRVISVVLKHFS
jgi:pyridoxal phosphate-dependent aminotransferase EpsN